MYQDPIQIDSRPCLMANSVCVAGILRVALVYNGDGISAPSKIQRFNF